MGWWFLGSLRPGCYPRTPLAVERPQGLGVRYWREGQSARRGGGTVAAGGRGIWEQTGRAAGGGGRGGGGWAGGGNGCGGGTGNLEADRGGGSGGGTAGASLGGSGGSR